MGRWFRRHSAKVVSRFRRQGLTVKVATPAAAAFGAAASFGDKAGAPAWMRLFFLGVALVFATVVTMAALRVERVGRRRRERRRLAPPPDDFVGRARALHELTEWLTGPNEGIAVVTGDP